ncbi:shikimate dehydrogenase [Novosphingobium sp. TH158]|uniref:shikimate dehydrogenase family protein n=1 Tax=Novosphingobium sp. TH158 TaxID=2067455 RepID=UPI000C7DAAE0|nr:shikimate dehydrogenase [Novosphingobium sp. TH158]PLK27216.1 shikimate dehydrogenase [Novosphingobium sp. TH158]
MTQPYAEVIGDPISQSKSPVIHGNWLARLGIPGEYRACHVSASELAAYIARRRADPDWRGCNVTIPHKEKVGALLDRLEPRAQAVGAVNTVFRDADGQLVGTNTDVDGVAEALRGFDLAGRKVVVLGAGGAARAAFFHLAGAGCSVSVLARNHEKARAAIEQCGLDARLLPFSGGTSAFDDAVLAINTTQLGMTGQDPMPRFVLEEIDQMQRDALLFDMVYAPRETGFLKAAAQTGRATVGGLTMLVGQARTAFARFFGKVPPASGDAELMRKLTA